MTFIDNFQQVTGTAELGDWEYIILNNEYIMKSERVITYKAFAVHTVDSDLEFSKDHEKPITQSISESIESFHVCYNGILHLMIK